MAVQLEFPSLAGLQFSQELIQKDAYLHTCMHALKLVGCMQAPAGRAAHQSESDVCATHAMLADLQLQVQNLTRQNGQMEEQLAQKDAVLSLRGDYAKRLYRRYWALSGQVCVHTFRQHHCSNAAAHLVHDNTVMLSCQVCRSVGAVTQATLESGLNFCACFDQALELASPTAMHCTMTLCLTSD